VYLIQIVMYSFLLATQLTTQVAASTLGLGISELQKQVPWQVLDKGQDPVGSVVYPSLSLLPRTHIPEDANLEKAVMLADTRKRVRAVRTTSTGAERRIVDGDLNEHGCGDTGQCHA
jgi:hypothetical protein